MKNLPTLFKRFAPVIACTLIALSTIAIVAVTAANSNSETVTTTHRHTVKFDSHAADLEQDGDTVMNAFDMQAIAGKVEWNDNDNAANARPDSVTVELRVPNMWNPVKTIQTTAADDWRYSFGSMPAVSDDGNKIDYSVTIAPVDGYASEYDGYDIKNTNIPGKNSVAVNIQWDDDSNRDGLRPDEVTIELDRYDDDNYDTGENKQKIVLSEANNWSYTFTDVNAIPDASKDPNKTYKWLVGELVDWRTQNEYVFHDDDNDWVVDASKGNQTVNIRNAHRIYMTDVDIKNVWDDDDSGEQVRPEKVIVDLATELGHKEVEIVADDPGEGLHDWTGHYEGPRYCNGKEVEYKILGVRVDDTSKDKYDSKYETDIDDNAVVTYNQHYSEDGYGYVNIDSTYEPADRYINEYLTAGGNESIRSYMQMWYEGDKPAEVRTSATNNALGLDAESNMEFQRWELAGSEDHEDVIEDLAGNAIPIVVHVNTYRPVLYQKFWAVGTDSSNGKLTLFIDACDQSKMPKKGEDYVSGNGAVYSNLNLVDTDYSKVVNIGTHNGDLPQEAVDYYDKVSENDAAWKNRMQNQVGWQTLIPEELRGSVQAFTIGNNIKEKIHVTSLAGWFANFKKIDTIDLNKIDANNCVNMSAMFRKCELLRTSGIKGLGELNTSKVITMCGMFLGSGVDNSIFTILNNMPMDSLKDIQNMFSDTPNITNAEISFKAKKIENVSYLFSKPTATPDDDIIESDGNCRHGINGVLTTVTIGMNFDNVKTATGMFGLNHALKTVNASGVTFTMPKAKRINNMFQHCFALTNVSGFTEISNGVFAAGSNGLTTTRNIFERCTNLKTLYFQGIRFDNIENETATPEDYYKHMLGRCTGVTVYINPAHANKVLKDSGMTVQNYLQSMLVNNTVKLLPDNLANTMSAFAAQENSITLPLTYTNYSKSGFVVRHAGETADKGQGRTLGDKKLVLTIHHRIKKIAGAPNVSQVSTVMPPVQQVSTEEPNNTPIGGLGDRVAEIATIVVALSVAAGIAYIIRRRRKS